MNVSLPQRLVLMALALVAVCTGSAPADPSAPEVGVPRYQPQDFPFRSTAQPANPFKVAFTATVRGPGGITLKVPGFHDGNGVWKVRVMPTAEGDWSLVTHSDLPSLNDQRTAFTCVPNLSPNAHGRLRIDSGHPRHFVFEDGTRYFPMGYECDWLWALDANDVELKTVNSLLDRIGGHGFNYLILGAYAYDTSWRRGKTADDDYGPSPLYPWEGSNANPDHSRFNLPYWQHFDRVVDALYRHGFQAHLLIKVYNKMVRWPRPGSPDDDQYFRWIVARYAAYPNLIWDFSKEAHNEKDFDYKLGRLRFLRENDPYRHLLTVHDDNAAYDRGGYDDVLDFRTDQQHTQWHKILLAQRQQHVWPILNAEFGYEHGPEGLTDKTYQVVQEPAEVVRRAWEICLAGGYVAYYYTYTAWDVIRPNSNPPGYDDFQRLRTFFDSTGYWLMEPSDTLVSAGYCLSTPGREYIVFQNSARPFTLKLEGLSQPAKARWYQPLTGQWAPAGTLENGTVHLQPPAEWGTGPVALHVGQRPAR